MNNYTIEQLKPLLESSKLDQSTEEERLIIAVFCWENSLLSAHEVAKVITSYLPSGQFISESAIIIHSSKSYK